MSKRIYGSLLASLVLMVLTGPAQALIVVQDHKIAPPPRIPHPPHHPPRHWPRPRPHSFAPLEIESHKVEVNIKNQVAVTCVEEVVYNQTGHRVEGMFLLPLPHGAQVDRFTMEINGKPTEAELLDADKAKKLYEDIVRKMRDPALMEYTGRKVFKVRIFPIEPNERKRITLKFTGMLKRDTDLVSFSYPLNTAKYGAKPIKNVSMKVTVESNEKIKNIYSPSHDVDVKRDGNKKATVGFELSNTLNDTDFHLVYSLQRKDQRIGLSMMTYHDPMGSEDAGYFMLLASPGAVGDKDVVVNKDIVFVFDTSGSMAGDKLKQAQKALRFCVANLNEGDRFEVVRFSTEAEAMFGNLVKATEENTDKAGEFIDRFKPVGGTAIDEALAMAIDALNKNAKKARPRMVIFLTDGRPTIGESNEDKIVANVSKRISEGNVRVFSFGVGHDVNTHLIDKITEKTRAVSQYVLPKEDIEIKVSNFYTKIATPVLAGVELKVHGDVKLTGMYPRPLPDLFKGDQLVVFGRYSGNGKVTITLKGSVNDKAEVFERSVKFANKSQSKAAQDYVARLWAVRRVGHLLDEINLHGEKKELKDEVVRLARAHGIVTPYTSYLILEDEERRRVPLARQTFGDLSRVAGAREAAGEAWDRANSAKSGAPGVARAQSNSALKVAGNMAQAKAADAYARYDKDVAGRLPTQAVQRRGNRTFYQNGKQWVDNNVQSKPDAKIIKVKFGTTEYFDLLTKHPEAANWLSVGNNVQLMLDDKVYEVIDEL